MRKIGLITVFALGCSGGSSGASGTGGADAGPRIIPGIVQLSVSRAEEQSRIGSAEAGSSQMFATVHFGVANGLQSAIALSPGAFRVSTAQGLEKIASPHSMLLADACPADAFLAPNQTIACSVTFELEQSEEPDALVYLEAGAGQNAQLVPQRVEAPIEEFSRCTRCAGQCADLSSDAEHCGGCNQSVPDGGSCQAGTPVCPDGKTICGGTCADLMTSTAHCGDCFQSSGTAACKDGAPSCPEGWLFGNGRCVDISSDDANCGQIGKVCSGEASCLGGKCLTSESSTERISCNAVCSQVGKQCEPYDNDPFFMYDCGESLLGFENAPCYVVPEASTPWGGFTCVFNEVYCHCG